MVNPDEDGMAQQHLEHEEHAELGRELDLEALSKGERVVMLSLPGLGQFGPAAETQISVTSADAL